MARRVERGDVPAHGVAGQVQAAHADGGGEIGDSLGLGADVVAGLLRLAAVAEAGQVEGDHMVALGQRPGEAQPVVLVGAEAVDQQQGRVLLRATFQVGDLQVVDLHAVLAETGETALEGAYAGEEGSRDEVEDAGGDRQQQNQTEEESFHGCPKASGKRGQR